MRILLFQIIFFLFTSPLFTQDASKNMHGFCIDLDKTQHFTDFSSCNYLYQKHNQDFVKACEYVLYSGLISGPVNFDAINKYAVADTPFTFKMSYLCDISPVIYKLLIMENVCRNANWELIGNFTGQDIAFIINENTIQLPFGGQGLFDEYIFVNNKFIWGTL